MFRALFLFSCFTLHTSPFTLPAFPGAEGWGADSRGGRGGAVINNQTYNSRVVHVTNLLSTGAGSLAAALSAGGPRYVVFDVSGTIDLKQTNILISSYVTVAGQTSPGGITVVNGGLFARPTNLTNVHQPNWQATEDIIIRHFRSRSGRWWGGDDNLRLEYCRDVVIDHCSFMNCCDEVVDGMYANNMTFSNNVIAESNIECGGEVHRHGLLNDAGDGRHSFIRNLFSHHDSRVPLIGNCYTSCYTVQGVYELVNNVLYNCHPSQSFERNEAPMNIIGNYVKGGRDQVYTSSFARTWSGSGSALQVYAKDNYNVSLPTLPQSDFVSGSPAMAGAVIQPAKFTPTTVTGQQAYALVAAGAGPFPRDSADRRLVAEVAAGSGQWRVLTNTERNTQTLIPRDPLTLPKWTRPSDTDRDGMPDVWEQAHGLNPADSTDFKTLMNGGYEAIEVYINELSDTLVAAGRWPALVTGMELRTPETAAASALSAFPNPFSRSTRISGPPGFMLQIYDLRGRRVERILTGTKGQVEWYPGKLPRGVYIVKVAGDAGVRALRICRFE